MHNTLHSGLPKLALFLRKRLWKNYFAFAWCVQKARESSFLYKTWYARVANEGILMRVLFSSQEYFHSLESKNRDSKVGPAAAAGWRVQLR